MTALVFLSAILLTAPISLAQDYETEQQAEEHVSKSDEPKPASRIRSRAITIRKGDTLSTIAQRELGTVGYTAQLAEFNELSLDDVLEVGDTLLIPIQVPADVEGARVVFVKGKVTLGGDTAVEADMMVGTGDMIATGPAGYVSLEFSSGSVVNLQPDSRARITNLNCLEDQDDCVIEIEAQEGEMRSNVEKREGQPVEFRIETPFASAAVRGTVFDFGADADELLVGVTEGEVVVNADDAELDLPEGFGTVTAAGDAPGEPEALLPPPVFRNIPIRMSDEDRLSWWSLSSAASYQVRLARDVKGRETVATWKTEEQSIEIPDADAGHYHVLLRAIADSGLKGFTSNTELTVAAIDDSVAPVPLRVTREGSEFLIKVDTPVADALRREIEDDEDAPSPDKIDNAPPGYEIQISNDESFSDPMSVDVNQLGQAVFQIDADEIFARARVLIDPQTVSVFGETSVGR